MKDQLADFQSINYLIWNLGFELSMMLLLSYKVISAK